MDGTLVDFKSAFGKVEPALMLAFQGREDEIPGLFSLMDPMPGALDAFHSLCETYDVFILSTAPWHNPSAWSDKLLWVQRHLGEKAKKRLILTHRKDLVHGDYLVDDRDRNGAAEFRGRLLRFGSGDFPDWAAVLRYLDDKRPSPG